MSQVAQVRNVSGQGAKAGAMGKLPDGATVESLAPAGYLSIAVSML